MWTDDDYKFAKSLLQRFQRKGVRLGGAESCTGGLVSALLTSVPGASAVFCHAYVTYSYAAKINTLGVPQSLLETKGAVNCEVALYMARAAREYADIGYGITGVAGPGFSERKPAGLVCIAVSSLKHEHTHAYRFIGDRHNVRLASLRQTLFNLYQASSSFLQADDQTK